jgi:HAD superfamily hydrolase (TIGR01490 family)
LGLVLFDLDNTLLAGDSDALWSAFMVEQGLADEAFLEGARRFHEAYARGDLDIHAWVTYALEPLQGRSPQDLWRLRERFLLERILPVVLPAARALVAACRDEGHATCVITATNAFVATPIGRLFGVDAVLATDLEGDEDAPLNRIKGVPAFREGKVARVERYVAEQGVAAQESCFFSDSHNDLPLLEWVTKPVAVDPDPILQAKAVERGWPIMTLRQGPLPKRMV